MLLFSASSSTVGATLPHTSASGPSALQCFLPGDGMGVKRQMTDTEHLAFRQMGRKRRRSGLCFPVPWLSRGNESMLSRSNENGTEASASFPCICLKYLSSEPLRKE